MLRLMTLLTFILLAQKAYTHEKSCPLSQQLVSDFDDTVKIMGIGGNPLKIVSRALTSKKVYPGMAELYTNLISNLITSSPYLSCRPTFNILSSSPKFLNDSIDDLLKEKQFPKATLFLHRLIGKDTQKFKTMALQSILETHKMPMILIGDDVEYDHTIYESFKQRNSGNVTAIYIHKVKNRSLPKGQLSYVSAFDLALDLMDKQLLYPFQVREIGQHVLDSKMEELIPSFKHCPKTNWISESEDAELERLSLKIQKRVIEYCHLRKN